MSFVIAEAVTKSYPNAHVLAEVSFRIGPEDRIGLVGPNGQGKTTLLRLIAGLDDPTAGTIRRKPDLRIGYLPQDPPQLGDTTLWQSMLAVFADLLRMERELTELAARLGCGGGEGRDAAGGGDGLGLGLGLGKNLLKRYGAVQAQFEAGGGYAIGTRIKTVLSGLGFAPEDYERPLAQFSGGQRTRTLLARLLLEEPEILLLDEPTNHLDLEALEWLERFLAGFRKALVVVSHDRYFLDRATSWTWEVSRGRLDVYRGGYSACLAQRQERHKARHRQWQAQQEHIARTEDFIRRHHAGQRGKEARGRQTRLERFIAEEAVERPLEQEEIRVRIGPRRRSGELVFRTRGLAIGYAAGRPLADVGDLEIRRGQRVALLGPNGVGKTTLLRTLMGTLPPLAGTVQIGASVDVGHMPQTHECLQHGATVLETLMEADAGLKPDRARTILGAFLFHGDDVFKRIAELSGGQRSRLILARLAVGGPNVLVLDEPTNHLDLPSREIVQDVLGDYPGTILFISHDRYLVQTLATHIWAMEAGSVHVIPGGWGEYIRWRDEYRSGASAASPPRHKQRRRQRQDGVEARRQAKQRQRLQKRQEELEQAIHQLEARLREMLAAAGQAGERGDLEEVRRIGLEYRQADQDLRKLWEEYADIDRALA